MRFFAKTTVVTLALLVVLQGCDFADVIKRTEPSTSVSQETALSSPGTIRGIRAKMYDRFHSAAFSTDWMLGPAAQADNTFIRTGANRMQGLNFNNRRAGIGTGAWNNIYSAINDANLLIGGIQEDVLPEAERNRLEAEARFIRALTLHHATRIFGYEPGMSPSSGPGSGFDLGVVIRTSPTLSPDQATSKARAPVSEVYSQIETDLTTAIDIFSSLPSGEKSQSPNFGTEVSAQALMARVQLYQREWGNADQRAQQALDLANSRFGSSLAGPGELDAIFNETSSNPEAIFTIDTDPLTESVGVNLALAAFTSKEWMAQIPTQDLLDLYGPDDARRDAWYGPCFDDIVGAAPGGCAAVNENAIELQKYEGEQSTPYADDYIHLRVAEMYLIQAEARLNTSGVSAAISRLNDLRSQRGASQLDPANFNFDQAYGEILAERRRELVAEGHRYFDLKRLGRDIRKAPGTGASDVPFEDIRVLDDIPSGQLEVNTELVQNPGYN